MAQALPARPNLDWLRKTAKDLLRELRAQDPTRKLADAQFSLARQYGFSGWRALKAHVDEQHATSQPLADEDVAAFLRHVGYMEIGRASCRERV